MMKYQELLLLCSIILVLVVVSVTSGVNICTDVLYFTVTDIVSLPCTYKSSEYVLTVELKGGLVAQGVKALIPA